MHKLLSPNSPYRSSGAPRITIPQGDFPFGHAHQYRTGQNTSRIDSLEHYCKPSSIEYGDLSYLSSPFS
jgi:hypothetical protein